MPDYEASLFDPPAPAARVRLRSPGTAGTVSDVPLLLDTGADVTLLPSAAVQELGVSPLPDLQYELVGFDGTVSSTRAVLVDVVFLNRAFRGRYLLTQEAFGVLGRDVLNHVALLLDGPHLHWSEQPADT